MPTQPMEIPQRIAWDDFVCRWDWPQGEHVVCIGPTGCGKSTLMRSVIQLRDWAVVLGSKKKDDTYTRYLAQGYERAFRWPAPTPPKGQLTQHVLLWPKINKIEDIEKMTPVFKRCLDGIFVDENWCVGLDDLYFLAYVLKLQKQISALNYQVRSMGVTLVSGLQRPAWVPRSTWDQASHAFIRRLSDADDVRTLRGLGKVPSRDLQYWLDDLKRYEWLYLPVAHADDCPPLIVTPPA